MKRSVIALFVLLAGAASLAQDKPRIFLQSSSNGNVWTSKRDQSIEMAKDFGKDCPDVKVTILQEKADYTVILNHLEVGFSRNNQMEVADKNGDLLGTKDKRSGIKGGVKDMCKVILADWHSHQPQASSGPSEAAK